MGVSCDSACDAEKLSKDFSDSEVLNARQCKGTFFALRSDPRAFIHRARKSLRKPSAQMQASLHRTSSSIALWMQKGSPWRAFLAASVGAVLLMGLAGLGTFAFFFLAATINAVVIGFLASVAFVGAFAALFFAIIVAIYIGVLVVAFLTISTIIFFCICAALTGAGWITFLWVVWQGLKKGAAGLGKVVGFKRPSVPSNAESLAVR